MQKSCPICTKKWYQILDSMEVCNQHQELLITKCNDCKRFCFSVYKNLCVPCMNRTPNRAESMKSGFNKNPRWLLVQYGLENYE